MVDHVLALLRHEAAEWRYRAYLTDALRIITENTAKFAGGSYMTAKWREIEAPFGAEKAEGRTGDEIAADVIKRIGLRFADAAETQGELDG